MKIISFESNPYPLISATEETDFGVITQLIINVKKISSGAFILDDNEQVAFHQNVSVTEIPIVQLQTPLITPQKTHSNTPLPSVVITSETSETDSWSMFDQNNNPTGTNRHNNSNKENAGSNKVSTILIIALPIISVIAVITIIIAIVIHYRNNRNVESSSSSSYSSDFESLDTPTDSKEGVIMF